MTRELAMNHQQLAYTLRRLCDEYLGNPDMWELIAAWILVHHDEIFGPVRPMGSEKTDTEDTA